MASVRKKPPDRPLKVYKCHEDTKFESLVCVICEDVYHLKDFIRRNIGVMISKTLAVCKKHEINLTSIDEHDHVLPLEARNIIAQLKTLYSIEIERKKQEYEKIIQELKENIKTKNEELQEHKSYNQQLQNQLILTEQKLTIEKKSKQVHFENDMEIDLNKTNSDGTVFQLADNESMRLEIAYLKELNEEMKSKNIVLERNNSLLEELLQKERENIKSDTTNSTYAEVAAGKKRIMKRAPLIKVKKTKKEGSLQDIRQKITNCLVNNKSIQTNMISERKKKMKL